MSPWWTVGLWVRLGLLQPKQTRYQKLAIGHDAILLADSSILTDSLVDVVQYSAVAVMDSNLVAAISQVSWMLLLLLLSFVKPRLWGLNANLPAILIPSVPAPITAVRTIVTSSRLFGLLGFEKEPVLVARSQAG